MKKKILLAIENIRSQIDYIQNNEDHINNYFDMIPDLFTYNSENVKTKIEAVLSDKFDFEFNDNFVNDLIEDQISYHDHFINLEMSSSYHDSKECLFTISCGEQEIHIFNNQEYTLTPGQREKVEKETGTVLSGSDFAIYAYIVLYDHIKVNLNLIELSEYIKDLESLKMYRLLKDFNLSSNESLTFLTDFKNVDLFKLEVEQDFEKEETIIIFNDNSKIVFDNNEYKIG